MGTVPWRLAMGSLAMVVMLSAFAVAPFVPGQHGPAPAPRSSQTLGAATTAADTVRQADLSSWSPQPAIHGTGTLLDQPVTMSDGTILRADVYFPTKPGTTTAASGLYPVLLQQTPYGKGFIVYASAIANTNVDYLVDRGFIVVIADVRGTGDSGGTFDLFDRVQSTDGVTLAQWAAHLSQSNGEVGLFGESYMGVNQFQTVEAAGPHSPIRAMFPIIAGNDVYSDTVTQGGIPDAEFAATYVALLSGLNLTNPALQPLVAAVRSGNPMPLAVGLANLAPTTVAHSQVLVSFLHLVLAVESGQGTGAFDDGYWAARSPAHDLPAVVADKIPAFLVGGWNDLFEAGEPMNYVGLQNLYDGRSQYAAMTPAQPVTPRYQLLMGPWQHVTTGTGVNMSALELEWFDTWLLGEHTPMGDDHHAAAPQRPQCRRHLGRHGALAADGRHADPVLLRGGAERHRCDLPERRRPDDAAADGPGVGRDGCGHDPVERPLEPVRHPDGPVGRRSARTGLPVPRHHQPLRPQRLHAGRRPGRVDLHHGAVRLPADRGRPRRRDRVPDVDHRGDGTGRDDRGGLPGW